MPSRTSLVCLSQGVSQAKAPAALPKASLLHDIQNDFQVSTGMSTTGAPLSAADVVAAKGSYDAEYQSTESTPDVSCFGGDFSQPCGSQAWLNTVASQVLACRPACH